MTGGVDGSFSEPTADIVLRYLVSSISALLPSTVVSCERFADGVEDRLFASEAEAVASAVESRRNEYASVRVCARECLVRMGVAPAPILSGSRGEPLWPAGVTGSMTHCRGYRAAAVAHGVDIASVGIDAEPNAELPADAAGVVLLPSERTQLAQLYPRSASVAWSRLIFSAKEAVYKACYPLCRTWIDFTECAVCISPGDQGFTARLLTAPVVVNRREVQTLRGRWGLRRAGSETYLLTAIVV